MAWNLKNTKLADLGEQWNSTGAYEQASICPNTCPFAEFTLFSEPFAEPFAEPFGEQVSYRLTWFQPFAEPFGERFAEQDEFGERALVWANWWLFISTHAIMPLFSQICKFDILSILARASGRVLTEVAHLVFYTSCVAPMSALSCTVNSWWGLRRCAVRWVDSELGEPWDRLFSN